MHPGRFDVLHDTHNVEFIAVKYAVYLCLFGPFEKLIDQNLVLRHVFKYRKYMRLQLIVIDDDAHFLTT